MSFVNCTKGEAKRLPTPRGLEESPWEDLDFLGWRDLGAPDRSYLVAEHLGEILGIALRLSTHNRHFLRRSMCSLCYTVHAGSGVSLMTARRIGAVGRRGDSAGLYLCTDMLCSLYVRGKKTSGVAERIEVAMPTEQQVARLISNLHEFFASL